MYNRQEVTQLLYIKKDDVTQTYENIIRLDQTVTSVPFIDSMYIYNGELKQFYVVGTERFIRDQADFSDKEASEWVTHPGTIQPYKPVYRQIPGTSTARSQSRGVFTYVLYDSIDFRDTIPRMIVINVKADWMMSNINNMSRNQFGPESLVYLMDSAGHNVTANPGLNVPGQELLNESCLAAISGGMSNGLSDGVFNCRIGPTDYLASYQWIPELNWRLLALSTNHFINTKIYEMRTTTIVFSCLLMAVGLLLTLLAARLLHGPIRRLKANVSALFEGGRSGSAGEFNYINQALTQIKDDFTQLQSFKSRHLFTLKQDLLNKLLMQPMREEQQLEPILRQLNIVLPASGRYVVVLILIDRLAESRTEAGPEWERRKQEWTGMLKDAFDDPNISEIIEMEDQWVVVLETTPTATGSAQSALNDELRRLGLHAREQLGLSFSMFVSSKGNGLPSIRSLYMETIYLSQYRLHYGQACILTDEDIQGKIEDHMPFPTVVAKQLRNCLVHGEVAEANRLLADLLNYFSAYSIQNAKFGMIYLLHQIYETIGMMDANSSVTFDLDLIDINHRLNECETLQEAKQLFRQLFDSVAAKLHERKEDKSSQWVEQMRTYIDNHLNDFNLSPSQIASLLRMSTDYVRKLFKKEMGVSMAAYINQERVKLLARQLIESDETIDALLEAMGWDNKNYFYKLFKDQFGVTPTEYRMAMGEARKLIR
jgi:AraC-like DNA-binding protein